MKVDSERQKLSGVSTSGDHCSHTVPGLIHTLHWIFNMHHSYCVLFCLFIMKKKPHQKQRINIYIIYKNESFILELINNKYLLDIKTL